MYQHLRPLAECAETIRAEGRANAERCLARTEERVKAAESNRPAFALLAAAGFALPGLSPWSTGEWYLLQLGAFPRTKAGNADLAAQVRKVRVALGCRLCKEDGYNPTDDGKRVEVRLTPVAFPYLRVVFERTLPRGGKCKLVKRRSSYTQLVCKVD